MTVADPRVIEQLNTMNIQLREINTKVTEMKAYVKSITESLQTLMERGMVIRKA